MHRFLLDLTARTPAALPHRIVVANLFIQCDQKKVTPQTIELRAFYLCHATIRKLPVRFGGLPDRQPPPRTNTIPRYGTAIRLGAGPGKKIQYSTVNMAGRSRFPTILIRRKMQRCDDGPDRIIPFQGLPPILTGNFHAKFSAAGAACAAAALRR